MEILRALLYALAVFGSLAVIAMLVAGIMKIMYVVVHRTEKKQESGKDAGQPGETTPGKVN